MSEFFLGHMLQNMQVKDCSLQSVFNIFSLYLLVNKQLADKERVAAALENAHLLDVVNQCLTFSHWTAVFVTYHSAFFSLKYDTYMSLCPCKVEFPLNICW